MDMRGGCWKVGVVHGGRGDKGEKEIGITVIA